EELLALPATEALVAALEPGFRLVDERLRLFLDGSPGLGREDLLDRHDGEAVRVQFADDVELRRVQRGPVRGVQRPRLAIRENPVMELVRVLDPASVQVAGPLLHPGRGAADDRLA